MKNINRNPVARDMKQRSVRFADGARRKKDARNDVLRQELDVLDNERFELLAEGYASSL